MKNQVTFFFIIIFLFQIAVFAQTVGLPVEHWTYPFLQRLQYLGLIEARLMSQRPIPRDKLARVIYDIDKKIWHNELSFAPTDSTIFSQLKGEFHDDLRNYDVKVNPLWYERHFYSARAANRFLYLDLFGEVKQKATKTNSQTGAASTRTTAGGILRGYFHPGLSFYVEAHNTLIKGESFTSEQFNPASGEPVVTSGSNAFTDDAQGYFIFEYSKFRLKLGRDRIQWGNHLDGGLIFHNNGLNYDHLQMQLLVKQFSITALHAGLQGFESQRFIAANRVDWQPMPEFYLALYQTTVYGNRSFQPLYQLPFNLTKFAANKTGDSINQASGLEINYTLNRKLDANIEVFLDQLNRDNDRFAYQFRITLPTIAKITGLDFSLSYFKVTGNTYDALKSNLDYTGYRHYNSCVGLTMANSGLNSVSTNIRYFMNKNLFTQFQVSKTFFDSRKAEPATELAEVAVQNEILVKCKLRWQIIRDVFVDCALGVTSTSFSNRKEKNCQGMLGIMANY